MSASEPPPGGGYEPPPGGGYGAAPPPPPGNYGGPGGTPPPNHLVWAILSTLFCCLPLGIASIVFAAQVNSKYAAGDIAGAQESSEKARKFALWATIIGVVLVHPLPSCSSSVSASLGSSMDTTTDY